jgi:selenocysteine lyase/cysteine desulfurase
VALQTTLAEAAATIARSLVNRWRGGEILVPAREFRSNLFPWEALEASGFTVRRIQPGAPSEWTARLASSVNARTRLVALSEVQSATGVRADIPAILARCRKFGTELFLNVTQSLGVLWSRPWMAEVDYVAAHGYKWLLAPRGATWLYVRPDRLAAIQPLAPNWKSTGTGVAELYGSTASFAPDTSKLDTSLAWLSWTGARAALELMESLPKAEVEAHCLGLAASLRELLPSHGLTVAGQDACSHIVAASGGDLRIVMDRLRIADVTASLRDGYLRFGCHFFNDAMDLERVSAAIAGAFAR